VRAIQYREHGGYDRLRAVELSAPEPDNGQALVRVTYAGVSPLDDMIRARRMSSALHKPLSLIPGVGGTGVVVGETGLAEGTRVLVAGLGLGVSRDGAWREYLAATPGDLIPIPDGVSDRQAAALDTGTGHLTAYLTLTELIDFQPGHSVFAPAVGGAVGMGSMQVARELGASLAISTTSRPDKAERARAAGFGNVIDLSRESLSDGVARLTGGKGVDVVIDGVVGRECTVVSRPVNRTAPREEKPRPDPPSQQVNASAVTGPTPYSCSRSTRGPRIRRAIWRICRYNGSSSASR
jgi:NADPH:quinone reductase-like Zn-dependent oxidoreductase